MMTPHGVDIIEVGDTVVCDFCNADYTNSDEMGGILVGSSAVCPKCTPVTIANLAKYGEGITDEPHQGETFKNFVLRLRGGDNTIKIYY